MSRSHYDIRKLRRSMSKPPHDTEYDRREDRGREDRRPYDSYRSRSSRSRSPVQSDPERYKGYQGRREEDRPQSKDSISSQEKSSRERSPLRDTESRSKHKVPAKWPRRDEEAIEPSTHRDTELTFLAPPPLDAETAVKRAYLKEQFPDHYFENLTFLPALEPISSRWADEAKAKIDAVEKQYSEMFKYSRSLSRIIRTLIMNTDSMQKTVEDDAKALKNLGKDLEDTQAQLVVAQRDAASIKQQFEDLQKHYHDLLESHTQERSELKKQAKDAKSDAAKMQLAFADLEREKAELAKKNAELEKKNADLASRLVEAENRVALAESNVEGVIKSAEETRKQLSEAEEEVHGFGELMIEFFAHIIRRRNISWIQDYPSTLVQVWSQIVEWEKEELKVDSIDEDKLMEKYLREDEPERLAEGCCLIAATMEEEKRRAKQKNIPEAGSSSTASETSEVEGYDPENPGITRASLLSPIPETATEIAVTPARSHRKVLNRPKRQTCPREPPLEQNLRRRLKGGKDKAATIDSGEGTEPSKADTPHDDEMIDALKDDGGNGGHEEDPEVAIVGESKSADDITLAALKAEQDKRMQLKVEDLDPESLKPLVVVDAGSRLVVKLSTRSITEELVKKSSLDSSVPTLVKKSADSSTSVSGKKKSKRILTDAEKEARDAEKAAKKSKSTSKSK